MDLNFFVVQTIYRVTRLKKTSSIFFAALLVAGYLTGCTQSTTEAVARLTEQPGWPASITDRLSKQLATFPNQVEFAFAKIEGDRISFYGVTRLADTLRFVKNENRVFEIGSITKVFTATLLAQAVEEGKLHLTDSLASLLPFPLKAGGTITLQQLANHTSGLPRLPSNLLPSMMMNPDNPYKNYTTDKLERYLREEIKLSAPPGQKMEYSNLGAGLLAFVLVQHQKTNYEELLQSKIFQPYGMLSSSTSRERVSKNLVVGVNGSGEPVSYWDLMALEGAGAVLSSTEDLARFALAQFNATAAIARTQTKTHTMNDRTGVGLGWIIREEGNRIIWHNGGTGGFSSCMALDLTRKRGMIVLSNYSRLANQSQKIDDLCFELLNH